MASTTFSTPAARRLRRVPLLALGLIALITGLIGGLNRIGWTVPQPVPDLAYWHGPLMISGFFGTLIGVERAVAYGKPWAYLSPLLNGIGTFALLAGVLMPVPLALPVFAAMIMFAGAVIMARRQPAMFTVTLALGAGAWLIGNALWFHGWPLEVVVPWWIGFLVLIIAGERLELSRLLQHSAESLRLFAAAAGLLVFGLIVVVINDGENLRLVAAGLLALAAWLAHYDIARRTIRQSGFVRFSAVCLLTGYAWLAVAGVIGLVAPLPRPGLAWDAFMHAISLGFVFSMVFAHAPIILPAILAIKVPYHPRFYGHFALLHASVALRLAADAANWETLRAWAGLGNVAALVLFIAVTAHAAASAPSQRRPK
ncbi:conserved membrane hypothetical protein [uncultured Gammaproteobacteria bacterium]